MDLLSLFRLLWRRRWVVLPTALIVGALLAATLIVSKPTYRSSTSLILLNPSTSAGQPVATAQNPYLDLGDMAVISDVLQRIMGSSTVDADLRSKGLTGTYAVLGSLSSRGPIVEVGTEAATPELALEANELVVTELQRQLERMQAERGASESTFIHTDVVVPPATVQARGSLARRLAAVAALGGGCVVASAILADVVATARKDRRRKAAVEQRTVDATGPDGVTTPVGGAV